ESEIEPQTFARNFSNGYLIGEILHKYHLLTDFTLFVNDDNKSSKVNNFNHLKPTLEFLDISFDGITAQELMQEKQGVALHLIYELYVALEKKKKGNIGGTVADMISNATSNHTRMKKQYLYSEVVLLSFFKEQEIEKLFFLYRTHCSMHIQQPFAKVSTMCVLCDFKCALCPLRHAHSELQGHSTKTEAESMERFNSEYIQQIRLRVKMDADTQKQRDRRVAHFLVEQSKARKAEQFEDSLVKRLTRQAKNEERLVAQLLQIHSEREVLMTNNLIRQQQIQKRREKDFQEALEREALDLCKRFTAEQKQHRYMKHFNSCKEIMGQIVDLSTKAGDYLKLTGSLIPRKQMSEWKELLFSGLPLYETAHEEENNELLKQDILNKHDYQEYKNMVGEWAWPETQTIEIAPTNSCVFDHVIVRLRNTVHPPTVKPFPPFSLKACVLGKSCSGKSTCLDKIAQAHGIYVLSPDKLVDEVLNAYHRIVEVRRELQCFNTMTICTLPLHSTIRAHLKRLLHCLCVLCFLLTKWALLGEAVHKVTGEGKAVPNELLVDVATEKIRQLPANSGWILDGFPVDIIQAHLLERALGGAVEEVGEVSDYHTNLTDPPKPSAPALDLALFLDIKDECVALRAASQTGMLEQWKIFIFLRDSIIIFTSSFEDTWPELEEWFGKKQNILVRVNADVDETELFKTLLEKKHQNSDKIGLKHSNKKR
uniref:Calponin-homology (CH) domain-containing protein n=1 Tax=Neogobius melanostomus TaxID=47308 RepID=A0A8C6TAP6_9GOBI